MSASPAAIAAAAWALDRPGAEGRALVAGYRAWAVPVMRGGFPATDHTAADAWIVEQHAAAVSIEGPAEHAATHASVPTVAPGDTVEVLVPADALNPAEWVDGVVLAADAVAWFPAPCDADGCGAAGVRAIEYQAGVFAYCGDHPVMRRAAAEVMQ